MKSESWAVMRIVKDPAFSRLSMVNQRFDCTGTLREEADEAMPESPWCVTVQVGSTVLPVPLLVIMAGHSSLGWTLIHLSFPLPMIRA